MPASVVRPTWIYTIMATLAVIALAACVASDTPREPAPAADTPTPDSPTPSEIGIDPATAAATLVQLVDELDEPEYYCVDVPGFGASLNLGSPLTAHTCKPGADDEMFAVDRPRAGQPLHARVRSVHGGGRDRTLRRSYTCERMLRLGHAAVRVRFRWRARPIRHGPVHGGGAGRRRADRRAEPPPPRPCAGRLRQDGTRPEAVDIPGSVA